MVAHSRFRCARKSLCRGQCGRTVEVLLERRGSQLNGAQEIEGVKQGGNHVLPIRPLRSADCAIVAEVVGVVPLAPSPDKSRLQYCDHIAVGEQDRLELRDMAQQTRLVRVAVGLGRVGRIGKSQNSFHTGQSHDVEIRSDLVQEPLREI